MKKSSTIVIGVILSILSVVFGYFVLGLLGSRSFYGRLHGWLDMLAFGKA
jgi:hypothetical protein